MFLLTYHKTSDIIQLKEVVIMTTTKKLLSVILAIALICTAAFSATAADISATKTGKFLKAISSTKEATVYAENIDASPVSVKNLVVYAKVEGKDDNAKISLKGQADISLGSLNASAYYDGKDLCGYLWLFKVNATSIINKFTDDFDINSYADSLNDIFDLANSPALNSLSLTSQTAEKETFIVSPIDYMVAALGVTRAEVLEKAKAGGQDFSDLTDEQIKNAIIALYNAGTLDTLLTALGVDIDGKTLVDAIKSTYVFYFDGDNLKNFEILDENGNVTDSLENSSPIDIKYIVAGKNGVSYSAPKFSIDITSLVSGIINLVASKIGG